MAIQNLKNNEESESPFEEKEKQEINFELIEVETVRPLYINQELINPDYELYRINTKLGRVYFRFENENSVLYSGNTAISREIPKPKQLVEWMVKTGWEESIKRYILRTLFGSFEHTMNADLKRNGSVDLGDIPDMVRDYFFQRKVFLSDDALWSLQVEAQMDAIAFQRWLIDFEVEIVASELPVFSDEDLLATQIDMVVFMTITKGSGKNMTKTRVLGIGDWKSTKTGLSKDEYGFLLESQKNLFKERFPIMGDVPITLFNLGGKKWRTTEWNRRTTPYTFSDKTDSVNIDEYNHYLGLTQLRFQKRINKTITVMEGKMNLGDEPSGFIINKSIKDIIDSGDWKSFVKALPENVETIF